MIIAGIDPGLKGAIAFHYPRAERTIALPLPVSGGEIDGNTFAQLLKEYQPDLVVVEKVASMPGQGVSSTFTFGKGYGVLLGVLSGLGISTELVTPQAWKKAVLAGSTKDKDVAIAYCRRVYPSVSLVLPGCRKPHDGIADSLCIMTYGVRKFMVRQHDDTEIKAS